jgi:membrane protease YdiL (CAAX protease family)
LRLGFFKDSTDTLSAVGRDHQWWIFGLAVVAAPLFEEFIFRGLIFRGLLRTWRFPTAALASAAIFAIVHPPVSVVPVFVLGLFTALSYERTGLLLAPILTHAVYNAIVVALDYLV